MPIKFQVFRSGTHKDSKGRKASWSNADLDKMVKLYNEGDHQAPIVIGHPKMDDPAWGWVDKLERKGNVLYAEAKSVVKEFAEAFDKGLYKKRSIAFYADMTLKHIGFLGAMPPAVKGLEDFLGFEESDDDSSIEFSEEEVSEFADYDTTWNMNKVGQMFRSFREYLIEKSGIEVADRVAPAWKIESLENMKPTEKESDNNFNEKQTNQKELEPMAMTPEEQVEFDKLKKENANFSEESKTLTTKLADETKRADEAEKKTKEFTEAKDESEVSEFCESLVKSGKLAAGNAAQAKVMLLNSKQTDKELCFGEGDDSKKKSSFEMMKQMFSSAKSAVTFGEKATKEAVSEDAKDGDADLSQFTEHGEVDEDRAAHYNRAKAYEKKHNVSFSEASAKTQPED